MAALLLKQAKEPRVPLQVATSLSVQQRFEGEFGAKAFAVVHGTVVNRLPRPYSRRCFSEPNPER